MFCITGVYPNKDGAQFDFEYYTTKHLPMGACYLGDNVVKVEVRKGVASADGSAPPFVCVVNVWINSVEEFQSAMAEHGEKLMSDIPNYTNIEPIMQVDEVLG